MNLQQVWKQKEQTITQLQTLKNNYLSIIYKYNGDIKKVHKLLLDETLKASRVGFKYSAELYTKVVKLAKKCDKAKDDSGLLLLLCGNKTSSSLNKAIYDEAREVETKLKEQVINDAIKFEEKVFFLISGHGDCAKDHLPYQARIYINADYKSLVRNKEEQKAIAKYVSNNNIQTFQWVVGKPVWMITRPNCRHYFRALSYDEVANNSIKALLTKYNMWSAIGKKRYNVIQHSTKKSWYNRTNIENIIKKYEERHQLYMQLAKTKRTPELDNLIRKNKLLIDKWKKYLNENY